MKRIFVLLAALAAVSAVVATSAFAGGGPTTGCPGGSLTGASNNVLIPAGVQTAIAVSRASMRR
jgi:hypothetical protein